MIGNGSVLIAPGSTYAPDTIYFGSTNLNNLFSSSAPSSSSCVTIQEGSIKSGGYNTISSGGGSTLLNSGMVSQTKSKYMKASDLIKLSSPPPDNFKKSTVMSAADVLRRAKS